MSKNNQKRESSAFYKKCAIIFSILSVVLAVIFEVFVIIKSIDSAALPIVTDTVIFFAFGFVLTANLTGILFCILGLISEYRKKKNHSKNTSDHAD